MRSCRPSRCCRRSSGCGSCRPARSRRSSATRRLVAGLHRRRALHRARLDRVDAGVPVRLGAPAVRRHRRRAVPRPRPGPHRSSGWPPHVTHTGVHDHGFNNVSTYGKLLAADAGEGRIDDRRTVEFYELALKVSGAVQAARWRTTADGGGYIYSFNGPHSLFVDTIRSLPVAGAGPPARPRAAWASTTSAISLLGRAGRARRDHRAVQRLLRRGPRRLRRARADRARGDLQRQRRPLPLPEHAAGLLAVHDLDARAGLGHARLRRATGVPRRPSRRRARAVGGRRRGDRPIC